MRISGVAPVAARTVLGANDRISIGMIGAGRRANVLHATGFSQHADCAITAVCDPFRTNLAALAAKLGKVDTYGDYRRILDRKDIDAVVIAAPDHWHAPMTIDAIAAGKDIYLEKPVSNAIEPALRAVAAVGKSDRVVQVGLMQRHITHFIECAKMIRDGAIGQVTQTMLFWEGFYTSAPEPAQAPPADLDWNMFQGPAEHRAYKPSRQKTWRSYYDYGGGLITDQGVHVADVVHWYLNPEPPRLAAGAAQYAAVACPEKDQVPDQFSVSWKYDKFVMSFTNSAMPASDYSAQGTCFYGTEGVLLVNRAGYQLRPVKKNGGVERKSFAVKNSTTQGTLAHTRDFLDCVKSRRKPLVDIQTGFESTLPLLLAVLAVRQGKAISWDGKAAKGV